MRNKGGGRAKKGKERRERGGKKKKGKSKRATITIRIPKTAPFYPASHSSSSLDALTLRYLVLSIVVTIGIKEYSEPGEVVTPTKHRS